MRAPLPLLCSSLLVGASFAASARAQDEAPPYVDVTAEGTGTDRGSSSGRASSTVDRDEIQERLPRSSPDALRYEPGVFVQQTAHGQGSAFIRGRTGQQTVLAFDGVRLSNSTYRQGPNQYFFTIDAQTIHSIEILRGGASTRYGSDALGGVIDATPIAPALTLGAAGPILRPRIFLRGATADGEYGFRTQLDTQITENMRLLVGAGSRRAGLLEGGGAILSPSTGEPPQIPALEDDGRTQLGTGFREITADGRLILGLGPSRRLVAAAYVYRQFDSPRTDQCPPPFAPRSECLIYDEQFRTLIYGSFEANLGAAAERSRLTVSYQRQHERRTRDRSASFVKNHGRDDVDTFGVAAKLASRPIHAFSWLDLGVDYGADVYTDWISSTAFTEFTDNDVVIPFSRGQYVDGSTYTQGGVFLEGSAALPGDFTIRVGGRAGGALAGSPADEASDTLAVDRLWGVAVGNAGVRWQVSPLAALLFNVDRSYRAPNLDDLTSRQQTGPGFQLENAELEPETATTLEVGTRLDGERFEADFWAFRSIVHGAITRAPRTIAECSPLIPGCAASRTRYQLVNLPDASTIDGVEAALRVRFPAGFVAKATFAYAVGEGPNPTPRPSDPGDPYEETVPLSRVPPVNGTAELRWSSPIRVSLGGALRWAMAQDRLAISDRSDGRIPEGGTPGFVVVDLRASYRLDPYFAVTAVLENVGDAAYRYHGSSVNGPGRGVAVQIEGGL